MQLANNSTRRMITQHRIMDNIGVRNDPAEANKFKDILVSQQSVSVGNLAFGPVLLGRGVASRGLGAPSLSQQARQPRGLAGAAAGKAAAKRDARLGMGSGPQGARSQLADAREEEVRGTGPRVSNVQAALQLMASSAHTFSIFDNNSFGANRVPNHRLQLAGRPG